MPRNAGMRESGVRMAMLKKAMDGFFNNLLVQESLNENVVDDLGGYLYEQYFSRDDYSLIAI